MNLSQKVFVSYVREDARQVNRLIKELDKQGVHVWLDSNDLAPGEPWPDAIRRAIKNGMFFIACFSAEFQSRSRTYMNEELNLAIGEMRLRPLDAKWFIPVKLSPCEIPDREIRPGQMLSDIQWVDLHSGWKRGMERIMRAMSPGIETGVKHRKTNSRGKKPAVAPAPAAMTNFSREIDEMFAKQYRDEQFRKHWEDCCDRFGNDG